MPSADSSALLNLGVFLRRHTEPAKLVGPDGEQTPLPAEVYEALVRVAAAMQEGKAVTLAPVDQWLTTQEAADLLGISRPTLIKLIDKGELDAERLSGSRHRRLPLDEVLNYQRRRATERSDLLTKLAEDAEDAGLYDVPAERYREALREARAARRTGR